MTLELLVRAGDEVIATVGVVVDNDHMDVTIDARWFGDAAPPGEPRWLDGLWEHEVVELFVAGAPFSEHAAYVELEVSPYGHWLALRFEQYRVRAGRVDVDVDVRAEGTRWRGRARVPLAVLPPRPWRVNANVVHGAGEARRYLSATVLGGDRPDFHRVWDFTSEVP